MAALNKMKLLFDGYYIPTTNSWGFLKCSLEKACDFYKGWNKNMPDMIRVQGSLRDLFERIGPELNLNKTIFMSTKSGWTAMFENDGMQSPAVQYMAEHLGCQGVKIDMTEHTLDKETERTGQYGGLNFDVYSYHLFAGDGRPDEKLWRFICLQNETYSSLYFDMGGDVLPFEQTERYTAKQKKDRFSQELLLEYCNALGLPILDESFYGPDYAIFHSAYYDAKDNERVTYDMYHREEGLKYGRWPSPRDSVAENLESQAEETEEPLSAKEAKREEHLRKFEEYGNADSGEFELVLPLDDFFEWAGDASIGYNLSVGDSCVPLFYETFKRIRALDQVEDVFVRILDTNDGDDWFSSDTVYVIGSLSKETLWEIMKAVKPDIAPDDIFEGWYHNAVPANLPHDIPASKVLAMWWD